VAHTVTLAVPEQARAACRDILATLPEWFGQADANAAYLRDIADKSTLIVTDASGPLGMIALDFHFETTAEIWLMAVRADRHRQGVGRALMETALEFSQGKGCSRAMVKTLSARNPDPGYAATRAFYRAVGFRPLIEFNQTDPTNPMMWMDQALYGSAP